LDVILILCLQKDTVLCYLVLVVVGEVLKKVVSKYVAVNSIIHQENSCPAEMEILGRKRQFLVFQLVLDFLLL
jgi:hypothetical protein